MRQSGVKKLAIAIYGVLTTAVDSVSWNAGTALEETAFPYGTYNFRTSLQTEYASIDNRYETHVFDIIVYDDDYFDCMSYLDDVRAALDLIPLEIGGPTVHLATYIDSSAIELDPDYKQDGSEVWMGILTISVHIQWESK